MVFQYYSDADMLCIKLAEGTSIESEEVAETPNLMAAFDRVAK